MHSPLPARNSLSGEPFADPYSQRPLAKDPPNRPCSPSSFIAEVLRKDDEAGEELKALLPGYTPPAEYAALHARGKEALETLDEMTSLLRSAICICERQGTATNWEGFATSIRKLGLSGVTARTYRQANTETQATTAEKPQDKTP